MTDRYNTVYIQWALGRGFSLGALETTRLLLGLRPCRLVNRSNEVRSRKREWQWQWQCSLGLNLPPMV